MSNSFEYQTEYVLDKSHFSETYDQSVTVDESYNKYSKAVLISAVGMLLLYSTEIDRYFAWFVVAYGGLEALSVRFKKPWWLARQMMSKAANNKLTLTVDEQGVSNQSLYVQNSLAWDDLTKLEKTECGWLLFHSGGKSYLSDRCLSEQAQQFIAEKAKKITN